MESLWTADPKAVVLLGQNGRLRQAANILRGNGWNAIPASTEPEAVSAIGDADASVLIAGKLAGGKGRDWPAHCKRLFPGICTISLRSPAEEKTGGNGDGSMPGRYSLREGFEPSELCALVRRAERFGLPRGESLLLRFRTPGGERTRHVVCRSPGMQAVRSTVVGIAGSSASTILIQGETGTGKEVIARAIHHLSGRSGEFVPVNCAALPGQLLQSELFGHEKGAFTDAREQKAGLFELADGGTLFLDEIGGMPIGAQAILLRAMEEKTIRRVGGVKDIPVDVRIVAASNRDLASGIREGSFREDLYYRLAVIPLYLPPLRERKPDIPPLVRTFLEEFSRDLGKAVPGLAPAAESSLIRYGWPGNVRELKNWAERTSLLGLARLPGDGRASQAVRLLDPAPGPGVDEKTSAPRSSITANPVPVSAWPGIRCPHAGEDVCSRCEDRICVRLASGTIKEAEEKLVVWALSHAGGNKNRAARILGINRATLYRKLDGLRRNGKVVGRSPGFPPALGPGPSSGADFACA